MYSQLGEFETTPTEKFEERRLLDDGMEKVCEVHIQRTEGEIRRRCDELDGQVRDLRIGLHSLTKASQPRRLRDLRETPSLVETKGDIIDPGPIFDSIDPVLPDFVEVIGALFLCKQRTIFLETRSSSLNGMSSIWKRRMLR